MTSKRLLDRIVTIALALAIAASIGAAAFATSTERARERFTEFYLLNAAGAVAEYPRRLPIGEDATVTLVIVNQERERMSYDVGMAIGGNTSRGINGITLEDGGRWEQLIPFKFAAAGSGQKVDFLLYKSGDVEPYRTLYLLMDIADKP
ncbi:MAG: DUF1616 domain-containing protein [Chloroflexi bacterium]|nr:DUF1616 domain-containing protein [Chloroflexota bacterium]